MEAHELNLALFLSLLLCVRFFDSKRKTRSSTLLSSTEVAHALPLPPSSTPLLNLAFCDCACVPSESVFVHVYGDAPWMDVTSWVYLPSSRLRWGHGQLHAFTGYAVLMPCMDFVFTRGRCNYHSRFKKKKKPSWPEGPQLGRIWHSTKFDSSVKKFSIEKKLYLIIIG